MKAPHLKLDKVQIKAAGADIIEYRGVWMVDDMEYGCAWSTTARAEQFNDGLVNGFQLVVNEYIDWLNKQ